MLAVELHWSMNSITNPCPPPFFPQALEYLFKFIVQSRILYSRATCGLEEEQFRLSIQELFQSLRQVLSLDARTCDTLLFTQVRPHPPLLLCLVHTTTRPRPPLLGPSHHYLASPTTITWPCSHHHHQRATSTTNELCPSTGPTHPHHQAPPTTTWPRPSHPLPEAAVANPIA